MRVEQGLTLLEMMAVLAIVAVVALAAIPAYDRLMARMESQRVASEVNEAIRRAKIEAARNQKDTIVCLLDGSGRCHRLGDGGLMVFVDNNGNNRLDATDTVAMRQMWSLKYGTLSMSVSLSRDYIKFMGDNAKPRGHIGSIRYCSTMDTALSHQLVLNMYGLVTLKRADIEKIAC
ncbi:type IV fimbrial biogenesis protein FimT [Moraxella cuniculi DSM 21768]|uniref:Type II secretion system protein H n=1 Tax=Moraxella cuniculi DSM 21768 TaxID=1122245 RepID=A0A1N7G2Q1_9GAMM|nr:GspH/FimT family pseudopilin [Moraxella cuniculi]OOS05158.1 pilus assembly protein [Moraxella cuniculi]SIS06784.1 type IV fimbrial biogenesis protein FimT [Moraxella cuniculi DSM 21768]